MLRSMTGYGKAEKEFANRNVSVEIKSVNHRYCDISVRTSRKYSFLEEHIKSKVRKKVRRGKIEIGLTLESSKEPDFDVKINDSLLKEYIENFKYIEDEFAIQSDVSISDVLSMPEVIIVSAKPENESEILMQVEECLEEAVEKFNQMREKEGASMERDILNRKEIVARHLNKMKKKVENSQETYMKMLRERIGELLKDIVEIPEEKVLTEAAFCGQSQYHGRDCKNGKPLDTAGRHSQRRGDTGQKAGFLNSGNKQRNQYNRFKSKQFGYNERRNRNQKRD